MNERIKKLEKQSLDYFWSLDDSVRTTDIFTANSEFTKKFAELIVRECMWKIMNRKEEAIDNDWDVDEAMSAAISDISEHFGVEQ